MRALDGPLSRRAQAMLADPSALVLITTAHTGAEHPMQPARMTYLLRRATEPDLGLGATGGEAYGALLALRAASRVCRHDWIQTGETADCAGCGSRPEIETCGLCGARRWTGHLAHMSRRGTETECGVSRTTPED